MRYATLWYCDLCSTNEQFVHARHQLETGDLPSGFVVRGEAALCGEHSRQVRGVLQVGEHYRQLLPEALIAAALEGDR